MGLAEELIAIKMRLSGATQYQREMQRSTAATTEYGDAAERAGAQAKSGAVGIDAMQASSNKGVGALTRMKKAGEGMRSTGRKLTATVGVGAALIGGFAVAQNLTFSDSMEQIATQAGASQREVDVLTKKILEYAKSGKSSEGPLALSKGAFAIESAGFRGAKAWDALTKSEELATVGHADFEKTSKTVAAAMATQIKGTQNLGETVGLMNGIVGVGSMRFEDLLSAMSTGLLDRAATFGLSLKEVGAALGTMTTVGQPAAASATRMGMAFSMIAAPTEKAAKAMEGIGLEADTLGLSLRKRGLIPTLELLKAKLDASFGTSPKGLTEQANAISEMFGGGRTSGGLMSLLRHIDLTKQKTNELTGATGNFNRELGRTNAQPITKLHQAGAQLSAQLIELGQKLVPILLTVAGAVVGLASAFSHLPGPVKSTLLYAGLVLAILGPIMVTIGGLIEIVPILITAVIDLAGSFTALDVTMAGIPLLIGAVAAVAVGLSGIFSGASHETNRLAQTSKNLTDFMNQQRTAGKSLAASEQHLSAAKQRSHAATKKYGEAQGHLNAVVGEYGPNSKPAIHAEQRLARLHWSQVKAVHALKNAEREHGIALQMTKQLTRSALLEGRHEVNLLKMKKEQFDELWTREKKSGAGAQRLNQIAEWGTQTNERLGTAHKKLNEVILEASSKIGPKYAQWLQKASRDMLTFGSEMGVVNHQFEQAMHLSEHLNELLETTPRPPSNPFHHNFLPGVHRPHHKGASSRGGGGGASASVSLMRTRGGPTPSRLNTSRDGGAGGGRRGTPVQVNATFNVGRRKFGEAMVMALIDEEVNS